jgi:hypothetical protein
MGLGAQTKGRPTIVWRGVGCGHASSSCDRHVGNRQVERADRTVVRFYPRFYEIGVVERSGRDAAQTHRGSHNEQLRQDPEAARAGPGLGRGRAIAASNVHDRDRRHAIACQHCQPTRSTRSRTWPLKRILGLPPGPRDAGCRVVAPAADVSRPGCVRSDDGSSNDSDLLAGSTGLLWKPEGRLLSRPSCRVG